MSQNTEFNNFITNWLNKADQIDLADKLSLSPYFDKFFTLYIVYNRLYAEVTFNLARRGRIDISEKTSFPDSTAAKSYVVQFVGSGRLTQTVQDDPRTAKALNEIERLIEDNQFSIKLDMVTGDSQRDQDLELLRPLGSDSKNERATAILDLIYSIRCNMFHGHKGFDKVQIPLLVPTIVLLRHVIELVRDQLDRT
jgi:hypothetical protein